MPLKQRGPWFHYRFTIDGQEYGGSTGFRVSEENRSAAEKFEKAQRQRVLSGRTPERGKDFAAAAGEFIAWCTDVEYSQKPNTSTRLKISFASLVEFFSASTVREIGPGEVERYKSHRLQINQVRPVTVRHDLHALSLFFQFAQKRHWCDGNPVRQVTIPSDRDSVRMHVVTREEERKYFNAAIGIVDSAGRPNLNDVAKIILHQGCRPDEIMSARKGDFDPKARTLAIRGGKSRAAQRALHLTPASTAILKSRLKSDGPWLFPSDRYSGNHITKLHGSHDKACIAAGASFVLYDLRHSFKALTALNP